MKKKTFFESHSESKYIRSFSELGISHMCPSIKHRFLVFKQKNFKARNILCKRV